MAFLRASIVPSHTFHRDCTPHNSRISSYELSARTALLIMCIITVFLRWVMYCICCRWSLDVLQAEDGLLLAAEPRLVGKARAWDCIWIFWNTEVNIGRYAQEWSVLTCGHCSGEDARAYGRCVSVDACQACLHPRSLHKDDIHNLRSYTAHPLLGTRCSCNSIHRE